MTRSLRPLLVAVAIAAAACDSSVTVPRAPDLVIDPSLRAETLSDVVAPGAAVGVRLINGGPTEYGYNLCGRSVERLSGDAWVELPPDLRICTAHLDHLEAGETDQGFADVRADAGPATYRFVFRLFVMSPAPAEGSNAAVAVVVRTNPFQVE